MQIRMLNIGTMLIILIVIFVSCSLKREPPSNFKNMVFKVKKELNAIEKIPLDNVYKSTGNGSVQGTLSFKKRAEYIADNKLKYNNIIDAFESIDNSLKQTKWYDDALFIRANFMLTLSTLKIDHHYIDLAIRYMTTYLELNDDCKIETWTKSEMEELLWGKLSSFFSNKVSEKQNINQFFYLVRASLYENNLGDLQRALEDYNSAFDINPESLWGQQAQQKIKNLTCKSHPSSK